MKLRDYLEGLSPDCPIKLYDENDDCKCIFDGYSGTIVENNWFVNWAVITHVFETGEMLIWIK